MLLNEVQNKLMFLDSLNDNEATFRMRSAPPKYKTPLQDWTGSRCYLVIAGEEQGEVNRNPKQRTTVCRLN